MREEPVMKTNTPSTSAPPTAASRKAWPPRSSLRPGDAQKQLHQPPTGHLVPLDHHACGHLLLMRERESTRGSDGGDEQQPGVRAAACASS